MRKHALPLLTLLALSFISAFVHPALPAQVPVHWDTDGTPSGFASKDWAVLIFPLTALILFGLFLVIPSIDPHRENIERFRKFYDGMVTVILGFLLYAQIVFLGAALGAIGNPLLGLVPGTALLLYYLGIVLEHAKMNWFVGVRTPWTLASEKVWEETHAVAGVLFKGAAVISLFGILRPELASELILFPLLVAALYSAGYSYFSFKNHHRNRDGQD